MLELEGSGELEKVDNVKTADDVLAKALAVRQSMLEILAPGGVADTDPKKLRLLNEILNGTEATAIGIKRLKVDESSVATNKETVAALLALLHSKDMPGSETRTEPLEMEPALSGNLNVSIAPGELVQGTSVVDFDTIMKS